MENIFNKKPYNKNGIPNLLSSKHSFGYNLGYETGYILSQNFRVKLYTFLSSTRKDLIELFDKIERILRK